MHSLLTAWPGRRDLPEPDMEDWLRTSTIAVFAGPHQPDMRYEAGIVFLRPTCPTLGASSASRSRHARGTLVVHASRSGIVKGANLSMERVEFSTTVGVTTSSALPTPTTSAC